MLNAAWVIAVSLSLQSPASPDPGQTPTATPDATPPVPISSSAPSHVDRPIARLLPNLAHDLFALPRADTGLIFGAGALGAHLAHHADADLASWARRQGEERSYTPIGGLIGNVWMQGGAAVATYAIGSVQDSAEIAHIGSDLIRAQMLTGLLTTSLKLAGGRTRPNGGSHSFPSGHTSATFASATVLASHYGRKVALPAYAVAGFIGWTRLRDQEHWLSDVIFGSAIGIAAGRTVTRGHGRSAWTVVPTMTGVFVIVN